MDKCIFCGTETRLYENDKPICTECADRLDAGTTVTTDSSNRPEGTLTPKQQ